MRASVATASLSAAALLWLCGSGPADTSPSDQPRPTVTATVDECVVESDLGSLDEYEFLAASAALVGGIVVVDADVPCDR